MSIQFGRWNLDGQPVDSGYLEKVNAALVPYGPDGASSYNNKNISILYQAFHTTNESHLEVQPFSLPSGAVITWDGRLDSRSELISELPNALNVDSTDVGIVAAAYEKWGIRSFAKLIGDWALAIWNPGERSLVLAKDIIGNRHLYYSFDDKQVTWSTILDPLVRFADKTFVLNEEYVAGWLSMLPAAHLTPCVGVHAVPPSSFVLLSPGKHKVDRYWDFAPENQIRYRTDAEYEEHFRAVFATAVQRRLRSDRPVLAELSGGRDSSSIVCMADEIIVRGNGHTPRLDTISYYDDSEPNWNERPYFTQVEAKRGRKGFHINFEHQDLEGERETGLLGDRFIPAPDDGGRLFSQVEMYLAAQGNRVVLSGIGGDEILGGVPTAIPELQDLLSRALVGKLAHQLKLWALEKRQPWFYLFLEAIRGFFPSKLAGVPKYMRPAPWLQTSFVTRHREALTGYPRRIKLFSGLPSFQDNMSTLAALQRQLAISALPFEPPFEKRYPYLDRDLLELIFAIPREQLVRPKQRRSLMRRALIGIVPDQILNRKRKAFVVRSPLVRISRDWAGLVEMTQHLLSSSLGIVDQNRLVDALQTARRGEEVATVPLMRTISLERWIRKLRTSGIVNLDADVKTNFASQSSILA